MRVSDDETLLKVKQWLTFGDEDLQLARHALTLSSEAPYRLIAYHAQQCAEKHLKAYLVFHSVDFPYTHNIARLLELCAEKSPWPDTIRDSEELTPFAITTRYPGVKVKK
ncbi:MAG: HEPN domain-containing protein [Deltaproteobacteria bacterium]